MLQLRDITKDYYVGEQTIHALQGISVDFRKSEFVSILGPSGCGKTTLMNIIGGLDKYTAGDLFVNAKSTKNFKDNDWDNYRNKKVGFVFQTYNLIPHLSVLGNVELALTISGISKQERKERAVRALQEVGLGDRLRQRPNQLSGGQMQRVAIARALVNEPEILLADEPTGALDTETSEQIMQLLVQIASNRLVVMVTHNPDIASRYSTRVMHMVDGKITEDSHPYVAEKDMAFIQEVEQVKAAEKLVESQASARKAVGGDKQKGKQKREKKSAMSFLTALSLSARNLVTKKGRTILTSIAGSIGIIGIALILALSNGMNSYVTQLQSDMLSSTPITISSTSIDYTQAMNAMQNRTELEEFPNVSKVFVEKAMDMSEIMKKNNITEEYINYVKTNLDAAWYNDIQYKTGMSVDFYGQKVGETTYSKLTGSGRNSVSGTTLLKESFVTSQYDLLGDSKYPQNKNEIALVISSTNQLSESQLIGWGLRAVGEEKTEYDFSDLLGKEFKVVTNNLKYENKGTHFEAREDFNMDYTQAETVKITAILRIKPEAEGGSLSQGIAYTQALYDFLQTENGKSDIVLYMRENPTLNPFKPDTAYTDSLTATAAEQRESAYRQLGGEAAPNEINIYSVSYDTKANIQKVLEDYNIGRDKTEIVTYTDLSELVGDSISSIINVITYVLVAFTAISLLVSSIMIGIITYVSVLERTKEIGILRSIGARKKDVTRVFNAETFLVGFGAGLFGVLIAYLLTIPINLIVKALLGIGGIATLNIGAAAILVLISVCLTVVSGLIPARSAAKRDPVTALRTE